MADKSLLKICVVKGSSYGAKKKKIFVLQIDSRHAAILFYQIFDAAWRLPVCRNK
ncbi:hypothetical protein [Mucilaginibacter flavus]|uniref:hypothetical protein n=1 Tax=Mucilaginibacter flavus TaxID=931504 RepID=UPI0025B3C003|nr:hypothetical protein [Mucilaginibacter flavus]MDN3581818.1 hypothetical protein [Mucilaginibacter flavus]